MALSVAIEDALMARISSHRAGIFAATAATKTTPTSTAALAAAGRGYKQGNNTTNWDSGLAYILTQALVAYETVCVSSACAGEVVIKPRLLPSPGAPDWNLSWWQ